MDKPEEDSKFSKQSVLLLPEPLLLVLVQLPDFRKRDNRKIFFDRSAVDGLEFPDRGFESRLENGLEELGSLLLRGLSDLENFFVGKEPPDEGLHLRVVEPLVLLGDGQNLVILNKG